MCNSIIPSFCQVQKPWQDPYYKFRHIPKNGIGWKLFRKGEKGLINNEPYEKEGEWVVWKWGRRKEAFCFFLTRMQAERCLQTMKEESWRHVPLEEVEVRKIEYRRGLLEREEYQFTAMAIHRIALCKMFRILDDAPLS